MVEQGPKPGEPPELLQLQEHAEEPENPLGDADVRACIHTPDRFEIGNLRNEILDGARALVAMQHYFAIRAFGDEIEQEARRQEYENSLSECSFTDLLASAALVNTFLPETPVTTKTTSFPVQTARDFVLDELQRELTVRAVQQNNLST